MRILAVDFRNDQYSFLLVDGKIAKTMSGAHARGSFPLLAKAIGAWGLRRRPPSSIGLVICTTGERPTWSVMRGAVAVVNSLAIAWNATTFSCEINGSETKKELAELSLKASADARPGTWVKPPYGGEPNITKARTVL